MRVRKVLLSNKPEGIEVILLLCIVIKQMCKQTSEEDWKTYEVVEVYEAGKNTIWKYFQFVPIKSRRKKDKRKRGTKKWNKRETKFSRPSKTSGEREERLLFESSQEKSESEDRGMRELRERLLRLVRLENTPEGRNVSLFQWIDKRGLKIIMRKGSEIRVFQVWKDCQKHLKEERRAYWRKGSQEFDKE